jgi:SAM-dependent methyltransferase
VKYTKDETIRLSESYADKEDPNGWFEEFYTGAEGDIHNVYWADLAPNPVLVAWLEKQGIPLGGARAVVVGCGLGDDAELLAKYGYAVTAFDISPTAIEMCKKRYPESKVDYLVGNLFKPPPDWVRGFALVYECNTTQILAEPQRRQSVKAIADLTAPGGVVLVSCRSRAVGDNSSTFPIAMDRNEMDGYCRAGLIESDFNAYVDHQDPPVPHFFAVYTRPS